MAEAGILIVVHLVPTVKGTQSCAEGWIAKHLDMQSRSTIFDPHAEPDGCCLGAGGALLSDV